MPNRKVRIRLTYSTQSQRCPYMTRQLNSPKPMVIVPTKA